MKVKFYAHACFRVEGDGLAVVTDPYTPGPDPGSQFDPVNEPADLVIMSSATDSFHSDPSHVQGNPTVVNAVEVPADGITVQGMPIRAYPSMESLTWDFGRDPEDNAMYTFVLDGIRMLHIGDIGNPLSTGHYDALAGQVDVMFALTGGHATIALDDLDAAIQAIGPRVVIPMHYYSPKGRLQIYPVTEFTNRYPAAQVTFVGGPEIEFTQATLPNNLHIYVLEQSR
jgi:L-ascorbate metabolism protein UlaG (beta-lactamase superfamily)